MAMQTSAINLVKHQTTTVDDLLKWALTGGRLLVIIVEIVAFSAFIYRFYLDRKISDLDSEIKGKQAIVASLKDREDLFRNTQARIALASELSKTEGGNVSILNDIINLTPDSITFNTFSLGQNQISIDANALSVSSLSRFVGSIRELPQVSSASILRIESTGQSGLINVFINIKLGENINP